MKEKKERRKKTPHSKFLMIGMYFFSIPFFLHLCKERMYNKFIIIYYFHLYIYIYINRHINIYIG